MNELWKIDIYVETTKVTPYKMFFIVPDYAVFTFQHSEKNWGSQDTPGPLATLRFSGLVDVKGKQAKNW